MYKICIIIITTVLALKCVLHEPPIYKICIIIIIIVLAPKCVLGGPPPVNQNHTCFTYKFTSSYICTFIKREGHYLLLIFNGAVPLIFVAALTEDPCFPTNL